MEKSLPDRALEFATHAHAGQRDKQGLPYIGHPTRVAETVRAAGHPEHMVAAAYLHDVVEDTPHTMDVIHAHFGSDVGNLVDALTRRDGETYMDFIHRCKSAGPEAAAIKLADISDNLSPDRVLPNSEALRDRYEKAQKILNEE
jgi:(p)ppGpp synthase/HD superfamily hydrolase